MLSGALLHIQKRIRMHKKLDPYPHPKKSIRILDDIITLLAIIGPIATLPQIVEIFVNKNAGSVSVLSWIIFTIFDIPWIIYGIAHKEKPIIIAYTMWFISNILVVIGALLY